MSTFSNDENNDKIIAMELLILSLAEKSTDEERRTKLNELYSEKMTKPLEEAQEFATLFDETIMRMGEEIQARARRKAEQLNQESSSKKAKEIVASSAEEEEEEEEVTDNDDGIEESSNGRGGDVMKGKSQEEKKLWAFIDMMVQSKSLAKKALG